MNHELGTTALEEETGENQRQTTTTKKRKVPLKAIAKNQEGNKIRRSRADKRKMPAHVRKVSSFAKSGCLKRSSFNQIP